MMGWRRQRRRLFSLEQAGRHLVVRLVVPPLLPAARRPVVRQCSRRQPISWVPDRPGLRKYCLHLLLSEQCIHELYRTLTLHVTLTVATAPTPPCGSTPMSSPTLPRYQGAHRDCASHPHSVPRLDDDNKALHQSFLPSSDSLIHLLHCVYFSFPPFILSIKL